MSYAPLAGFLLVFAVIGGTELIDRTFFALVGLATRYHPGQLWAGASLAFVLTTLLAIGIGDALVRAFSGDLFWVRLGGGIFLLAYAAYLYRFPEHMRGLRSSRSAFATAFTVIILLELGDTTMLWTIFFVTIVDNALIVGVAAGAALVSVAALAAFLGSRLATRVDPERLERWIVVILAIVGGLTILLTLFPNLVPPVFR